MAWKGPNCGKNKPIRTGSSFWLIAMGGGVQQSNAIHNVYDIVAKPEL